MKWILILLLPFTCISCGLNPTETVETRQVVPSRHYLSSRILDDGTSIDVTTTCVEYY